MELLDACPTSGRLPESLRVDHGPVDLLGRFFLWADTAARERGVSLSFASFAELEKANEANRASWRPLVPIFHHILSGIDARTGFVLLGRNRAGDVVAAQAARLYDWPDTSLREEANSLRMFYADPAAAVARGDRCAITAPSAPMISGRVVFSGAGWYRPDFRGKGLATILPRISRAYAFTRWNSDFTISMIGDAVIAGGMAERTGYTNVEGGQVDLTLTPLGSMTCALVWMKRDELLRDLETVLPGAAVPALARASNA